MEHVNFWRSIPLSMRIWLVVLCTAHLLDITTTVIGLRLGIPEGNPLMSTVLHHHGEVAMFGLKILLIAGLLVVIWHVQRRYRHIWPFFLIMTIPPTVIVANNLALIVKVAG